MVSEGNSHWYGRAGAFSANAFITPSWQALRGVQNLLGSELHSPASLDAMRAGYQGAFDALRSSK